MFELGVRDSMEKVAAGVAPIIPISALAGGGLGAVRGDETGRTGSGAVRGALGGVGGAMAGTMAGAPFYKNPRKAMTVAGLGSLAGTALGAHLATKGLKKKNKDKKRG